MSKTQVIAEPGQQNISIVRDFDAPKMLLFRACIEPDLLAQWYGPRTVTMTVDRLEPREGGRWHFSHRTPDGYEFTFHGVFHGTPSPETGIVQTAEFSGAPGHVALEIVTFETLANGKTRLRTYSIYQSVEDRDAVIASGMESGLNESYERLDELVARTAATR